MKRYLAWVEVTVGSVLSTRRSKWYISGDFVNSVAWVQDDPESAYHYPSPQAAELVLGQTTMWAREMSDFNWGVTQIEVTDHRAPRGDGVFEFVPPQPRREVPANLLWEHGAGEESRWAQGVVSPE